MIAVKMSLISVSGVPRKQGAPNEGLGGLTGRPSERPIGPLSRQRYTSSVYGSLRGMEHIVLEHDRNSEKDTTTDTDKRDRASAAWSDSCVRVCTFKCAVCAPFERARSLAVPCVQTCMCVNILRVHSCVELPRLYVFV